MAKAITKLIADAQRLEAQRDELLEAIEAHRNDEASSTSTPQKFSRDQALYAAADKIKGER